MPTQADLASYPHHNSLTTLLHTLTLMKCLLSPVSLDSPSQSFTINYHHHLHRPVVRIKYRKNGDFSKEPISAEQRSEFFDDVHDDWSTLKINIRVPKAPKKDKWDSTIEVGRWMQNLPPSKPKRTGAAKQTGTSPSPTKLKRKKGDDDDNSSERRKDEPAYLPLELSVRNSEPKLTFDWKDASNQHAGDKYISFNPGMDYETAKVECVANYDDRQKSRGRDYNLIIIVDLVKKLHIQIKKGMPLDWATYRKWFKKSFKEWNSFHTFNPNPTLSKREFQDTNVLAGYLLIDHPSEDGSCPEHRKKGSLVFLSFSMNLEREALLWLWKDARGQFINPEYVDYLDNDKSAVLDAVVQNYDTREKMRIQRHNVGSLINTGRRRVVKWTAKGSGVDCEIEPEDYPPNMEPLCLTNDYIIDARYLQPTPRAAAASHVH
ncbi:hypothetical protein FSARC_9224 [Fusarium sarcochroum]|uniref:Uncharacterized protein n=1 Tax=Fusarium sarcochroum TaxID=1208366 RepID=A0A8H4TRG2_9HYPO|nr:hypothetical protein FSARC_9224 [Fusarium sarcochroum]